jgi:hypothetical protein
MEMGCKSGKKRERQEKAVEESESQLKKYGINPKDALPQKGK